MQEGVCGCMDMYVCMYIYCVHMCVRVSYYDVSRMTLINTLCMPYWSIE